MNRLKLEEQLLSDISKANVNYIVSSVGNNHDAVKSLWNIIVQDRGKVSVMAAWTFDNIDIQHPGTAKKYIQNIIERIKNTREEGIIRILLKLLCRYEIPDDQMGLLFNICTQYVEEPKSPIAIKANSMQILYNISETVPDLKSEIIALLEFQYEYGSPGFKSRADKLLQKLYKQVN